MYDKEGEENHVSFDFDIPPISENILFLFKF